MTIIAWDGKMLAADKLSNASGLKRTTTKIWRVNGHLVGASGIASRGRELVAWWADGADPAKMPAWQHHESDWVDLLVITPDRQILKYERAVLPIIYEDAQFAMGSGRDFALAAMHLGCSAAEAVEVASRFQTDCGHGCDTLEF